MHELSLAKSICDTVARHVLKDQRVACVVVELGPLSGVVADALQFGFEMVAQQSGLAGARLEVHHLVAQGVCPECQAQVEVREMWAACPSCGHEPVTVHGGTEFRLKEIEVEDV